MKDRSNIWLYLALLMTVVIWTNSMFSAEISSNQSGFITDIVLSVLSVFKVDIPVYYISSFVRTFAHFAEFFILAIFWGFYFIKKSIHIYWVFLIAFFTALCDESIQLFSDGRAFQIFDLAIDNLGATFGVVFHLGLLKQKKDNML